MLLWLTMTLVATAQSGAASLPSYCVGDYADSLEALNAAARRLEQDEKSYSYCVRATAVYECVGYGSDGELERNRMTTSAHGTAFAYKQQGDSTLLLTNAHVAEFPLVTDADHRLSDVPLGCKKMSETLKIVDSDTDDYDHDDIRLTRVALEQSLARCGGLKSARRLTGDALEDRAQRRAQGTKCRHGSRFSPRRFSRDERR